MRLELVAGMRNEMPIGIRKLLFQRVADPRTLQGCGDPRTLFEKRVRGGPFFEKINTAMVRGATERRP